MKRIGIFLLLVSFLLLGSNNVSAAPEWTPIDGTASEQYFIDINRIAYSGEEPETVFDYWVKIVPKDKPDTYSICHVLARKSDMNFIEKERTLYSATGEITGTSESIKQGWKKIKNDSYIEKTAKYLLNEYKAKPSSREYIPLITIEPQQFSKAVESQAIRFDQAQDGTKRYLVRDTTTQSGLRTTMDFWVLADANNNKTYRFNLSTLSALQLQNIVKVVVIYVDDEEWVLAAPLPHGATNFPNSNFQMSYDVSPALYQAIVNAKKKITIRWYYGHGGLLFGGGEIRQWQYTLPEPVMQNIKILYAGCK